MAHRDLHALEAAERAADAVNRLIDRSPRKLLYITQMREAVGSIGANISEGFGRREGPERQYKLEVAKGEAEETISRLSANYRTGRISGRDYWPIHNILTVTVKMINGLMHS